MVLRWGTPRTPSGQAADSSSIDGKGFSSDRSWCWRTRRCRRGLQWSLRCFPSGTRHSNVQVGNCRWTIVTPTTKTGADDQVTLRQKEATSFRNAFIEKDYQRRWFGARWTLVMPRTKLWQGPPLLSESSLLDTRNGWPATPTWQHAASRTAKRQENFNVCPTIWFISTVKNNWKYIVTSSMS